MQELHLPPLRRQAYRLAIVRFLQHCRQTRQPAKVLLAREFMRRVEERRLLSVSMLTTWKEGLNWFFKAAQEAAGRPSAVRASTTGGAAGRQVGRLGDLMTDVPPVAAADLGRTDWERSLIRALRNGHDQWRTEQAYRGWARRFAQWLDASGQRRAGNGGAGGSRGRPSTLLGTLSLSTGSPANGAETATVRQRFGEDGMRGRSAPGSAEAAAGRARNALPRFPALC